MSPFGLERHPKYGDRQGTIVGRGSPNSWRIKFDERSTVQSIHTDYLELATVPLARPLPCEMAFAAGPAECEYSC